MGAMGRTPSDDYDYGEPGKWGEPNELIDYVEGDDDDPVGDPADDEEEP